MEYLNVQIDEMKQEKLFNKYDNDGSGQIDYEEFKMSRVEPDRPVGPTLARHSRTLIKLLRHEKVGKWGFLKTSDFFRMTRFQGHGFVPGDHRQGQRPLDQ